MIFKYKSLFFILIAVFSVSISEAKMLCLYSRSTNDAFSGHAFVTLQQGEKIIERYGLWPKNKVNANDQLLVGTVVVNKTGDLPLSVLAQKGQHYKEKYTESKTCEEVGNLSTQQVREAAIAVGQRPYETMGNNCTHFAIRLYNAIVQHDFPRAGTPKKAKAIMVQNGLPLIFGDDEEVAAAVNQ